MRLAPHDELDVYLGCGPVKVSRQDQARTSADAHILPGLRKARILLRRHLYTSVSTQRRRASTRS
jgi:hypothetical protein